MCECTLVIRYFSKFLLDNFPVVLLHFGFTRVKGITGILEHWEIVECFCSKTSEHGDKVNRNMGIWIIEHLRKVDSIDHSQWGTVVVSWVDFGGY